MKKYILLVFTLFFAFNLTAESISESNINEKIEYINSKNEIEIYHEVLSFLEPKWNFDRKYSSQVLGYLSGYLLNNEEAIDFYYSQRECFKDTTLVKLIDSICIQDFSEVVNYIQNKKLSFEGYLWYMYFGNKNNEKLSKLIKYYSDKDENDLGNLMMIRYFYERHEEVMNMIDNQDEKIFENVRKQTYDEMNKKFYQWVRDANKK
jgi:hypothetical protein